VSLLAGEPMWEPATTELLGNEQCFAGVGESLLRTLSALNSTRTPFQWSRIVADSAIQSGLCHSIQAT